MGSMILNLAANMLGLGNAATPFGLKAMSELNTLNRLPGVATNSMALFLSINAAGVAILPLGAVAVRAALGSKDPAGIVLPSFLSTFSAAVTAVVVAKLLERAPASGPSATPRRSRPRPRPRRRGPTPRRWRRRRSWRWTTHRPAPDAALALGLLALFVLALVREVLRASAPTIPASTWSGRS